MSSLKPRSEIVLVAVASGIGSAGFRAVVARMKWVDRSGPESPSVSWAIGLKKATRTPLRSNALTRPRATVVSPMPEPAGARKNACFMGLVLGEPELKVFRKYCEDHFEIGFARQMPHAKDLNDWQGLVNEHTFPRGGTD